MVKGDLLMFRQTAVFADRIWRAFVIRPIFRYQAWRCERAKAYLLRHDVSFREAFIGKQVMWERDRLYERGISPMDPQIPDRWSVEEKLPPMAWPR